MAERGLPDSPLNLLLTAISWLEDQTRDNDVETTNGSRVVNRPTDRPCETPSSPPLPIAPRTVATSGPPRDRFLSKSKEEHEGAEELCQICGDKASGIHYRVMTCEGCKGFFRRSIRKGVVYKCYRRNDCSIEILTRNQCQACRFRKCLEKGMSKEAIQPERNRKPARCRAVDLPRDAELVLEEIVAAHEDTFAPTHHGADRLCSGDATMSHFWDVGSDFSETGIEDVFRFATKIRQFYHLNDQDRRTLLEGSLLEITLLRAATRYFPDKECIVLPNSSKIDKSELRHHLGELFDTLEAICRPLMELDLYPSEMALLQALLLFSPDRQDLSDPLPVWEFHRRLRTILATIVDKHHLTRPTAFIDLWAVYGSVRLACLASPLRR